MKGRYEVEITSQAQEQLEEIVRYIAVELQAPKSALDLLGRLERSIASLDRFPARIALTEEEPWRGFGIHKMVVKNHLVYFWIDEAKRKVHITAVVCARRDQRRQLSEMSMD